jgi:hypothetical protein
MLFGWHLSYVFSGVVFLVMGGKSHIYYLKLLHGVASEIEGSLDCDDNELATKEGPSTILLEQRKKTAGTQLGHAIINHASVEVFNAGFGRHSNTWYHSLYSHRRRLCCSPCIHRHGQCLGNQARLPTLEHRCRHPHCMRHQNNGIIT